MEDKLGLLLEMMRDIKADIKDLEHNVNELSSKVVEHSTTHGNINEIRVKVEDLEKFRSKVKGAGSVLAILNAAILGYFKSKGA